MAKTKGNTAAKFPCVVCNNDCSEDAVCCDKCDNWVHNKCSKLSTKQLKHISKPGNEFICSKCDPKFLSNLQIGASSSLTSNSGGDLMLKEILKEIKELKTSVDYISNQYDEIKQILNQYDKKYSYLEKENSLLKAKVDHLENEMTINEKDRLRNDLIVSAENQLLDTDPTEAIVLMASEISVNLAKQDISAITKLKSYTVNGKDGTSYEKSILRVTLVNSNMREQLLRNKKNLKQSKKFQQVSIREALPRRTLELLQYAGELRKFGYTTVYSLRGKIYAKLTPNDKPLRITDKDAVDSLMSKQL